MAIAIHEVIKSQDMFAAAVTEYTYEKSTLGELSKNFPHLEDKGFEQWIAYFDEIEDVRALEFGGGPDQVAARQILERYPHIEQYIGYDARPLSEVGQQVPTRFPSYRFERGGLSSFDAERVKQSPVDIAFAHNVAEHVPHPFQLMQQLYETLAPGGVLFINGIPLYREVAEDVMSAWRRDNNQIEYQTPIPERDLLKSGVVKLNVAVRKKSDTIFIPSVTDIPLRDFSGRFLPTLVYRRPRT